MGMRKWLFPTLCTLILSLSLSAHAAVRIPYFVVLPDGVDMNEYSTRLEKLGAAIRMRMPPNVLTFDLDSSLSVDSAGPLAKVYRSIIPLTELESYGPLAQAAGIQWNRQMVHASAQQGFKTAGAMRTLAAQNSLPSPSNLAVSVDGGRVHVSWKAVPGAASYLVQLSQASNFTNRVESVVMKAEADMPLPAMADGLVYARVKSIDADIAGGWSDTASASAGAFTPGAVATVPVLTSPLDNADSDGFTVVLEWIADPGVMHRVQVAEKSSFDAPVVDLVSVGGEFSIPSAALKLGKQYYWRVRSWTESGSDWSAARRLNVTEPRHTDVDALINPEAPR